MKVGKAIYNILSQSTDVQSNFPFNTTDYSPTGTELVTNGDFSAAGSNLVSNPNFTETGSELVVNGDFDTDSDWTKGTGWSIIDSKAIYDGTGGTSAIRQTLTVSANRYYKISFTVLSNEGTGTNVVELGSDRVNDAHLPASATPYVFYGLSDATTEQFNIYGRAGEVFEVDNVSVKELGADWTVLEDTCTFGENGVTMTSTEGTDLRIRTGAILADTTSYKVTYTIHAVGLTGTNAIQYYTGSALNSYDDLPEQGIGTHTFYYTTPSSTNNNWYFRLDLNGGSTSTTDFVTISSISVQELGEGWTLGSSWSVGDDKAVSDGTVGNYALQQTIFSGSELGNYFKVQYEITSYTSGTLLLRATGFHGAVAIDNAVGVHTLYLEATSTSTDLVFITEASGFTGSISNISVEEMVLNKIFPELAPPDIDAPYVVYSVVSNSPSDTKNANGDIDTASIEVYGFQDTYNKAVDLGVSIRAALDRKTGTYNTIEIQSTNYVNEQMDVNEARKLWAAIQDYSIRIKNI